jgi:hypothetical protein
MSDETAVEISPPTDDDDITYKFQIAIKVEPFLCCGDGEPESAMTRFSGDIRELDEDCEPDEVVGHVEFCIADFRAESPSWVLDGRMEDAKFINLFGNSPMIQSITNVPDYAVMKLSAATLKALGGTGCTDESTSCPNVRSAVTVSPGKFSSARNRIVRRSPRDTPFQTAISHWRTAGMQQCRRV